MGTPVNPDTSQLVGKKRKVVRSEKDKVNDQYGRDISQLA